MSGKEKKAVADWMKQAEEEGKSFQCDKIKAFLSYKTCNYQRTHGQNSPICATCLGPVKPNKTLLAIIEYK